jgi:hypothetical protein
VTTNEPDLLVIDVDGNDYFIWEAISSRYVPRVVVIEYNAGVGPHLRWFMPYNAEHRWEETSWHGASLAALASLGSRLGYDLIGCDSRGVNAFFVRTSEAAPFTSRRVSEQWVPPLFQLPYGHPRHPFAPFRAVPISTGDAERIRLQTSVPPQRLLRTGESLFFYVEVVNDADMTIGYAKDLPTQLAYWWLDESGNRITDEPERCPQAWRADSRETAHLLCKARTPELPGTYALRLGLVQEGVMWLEGAEIPCGEWVASAQ